MTGWIDPRRARALAALAEITAKTKNENAAQRAGENRSRG